MFKKYILILKEILFLPFQLFFRVKPVAYKINQADFNVIKEKRDACYESNRELHKKIELFESECKIQSENRKRIVEIVKHYEKYDKEVVISKHKELVIIFFKKDNIFDIIYLCGENGRHPTDDSRIFLSQYGKRVKIFDFISHTKNKGYGRVLINFAIKKAKELAIEEIYGDLSSIDKENFEWLISFYESVGFECTLFENPNNCIYDKLSLKLNTNS